ncbi:unnamed protein product [Spirodela intermedia]|uniref:DDT domain-containing protein n=1 Tax=Spirodela intermedia TaxID=51605 RepID=A0A7I8JHI8_SPIIN|nr:unnamed protein product [Spirodela intermedia]CAA6669013.1 unnamed protein product [Spirodela intermedia]
MKVNGVGDAGVRELNGIGSPRADGVGQFEDDREFGSKCVAFFEAGGNEAVELKPVSSSGPKLERELRNGGDVDAHGNGDASSKDGEDAPLEAPRKRRRLSAKVAITPDMPLRRSARRAATATALSDPYVDFSSKNAKREKRALEKKPSIVVDDEILVMPPSSKDLEIDGLPVLDVFSVYSCLRSFSTLIFLSPFSLKAFVAALKCNIANSLIDAVHYSILQALKRHLEALSEEGSKFASNCLRNLNWELLDTVNWPLYVAEYLLIHRPEMCSGVKLLNGEYYDQSAASKLEILRHLCDDVIEVEVIRAEINKRMLKLETNVDTGQNTNIDMKGRADFEEMSDGNSDWCCLCGMDGSLICCDGCPAAFHSRWEWFCPECMVQKFDGNMKTLKSFQGAEVLGTDRHGRIYFCSCGYLLVSEPPDRNPSYRYYNGNDVHDVIELLKLSYTSHARLISSITDHWGIPVLPTGSSLHCNPEISRENVDVSHQLVSKTISPLKDGMVEGVNIIHKECHVDSTPQSCNFASGARIAEDSAMSLPILGCTDTPMLEKAEDTCSMASPVGRGNFSSKVSDPMQEIRDEARPVLLEELSDYVNWYSFGRVTSSVGELITKSSNDITKSYNLSADDIMSAQLRAIYKKSINQYWSAVQRLPVNAQKEVCGWCFACKNPSEQECLLRVIENKMLVGSRKPHRFCHSSHLTNRDNVHGLLSGPWHNPYHKKQWRKNVLKAVDVMSLKHPLLTLELHLRRVALSSEWMKPVDSTLTVGSGSYVLSNAVQIYQDMESKSIPYLGLRPLASFGSISDAYWWRGGRLSRQVFNWNMLPKSLVSKGGRQGSEFARRSKYVAWRAAVEMSKNVAQLMYQVKDLDSNIRWTDLSNSNPLPMLGKEYRKSLKPLWKATICQKSEDEGLVKYLLDFGKRKSFPDVVTKHGVLQEDSSNESKKYWLDESYVPINLLKTFEARKLEKMLKRASLKVVSDKKGKCKMAKPRREKGLSYLLSRGENSDQYLCRHCGKLVEKEKNRGKWMEEVQQLPLGPITMAPCGKKGSPMALPLFQCFIHRRHFRVPKGAITTTYRCYACKDKKPAGYKHKKFMNNTEDVKLPNKWDDKKVLPRGKRKNVLDRDTKILHDRMGISTLDGCNRRKSFKHSGEKIVDGYEDRKRGNGRKDKKLTDELKERKLESRSKRRTRKPVKCKILAVRKSERLAKKKKHAGKIKKQKVGFKKGHKLQTRKGRRVTAKVSKEGINWHKRQRTGIRPPFWLNGLLWTRKAFDERAIHFRETSVLLPSSNSKANIEPVCSLCHQEYDSHVIYVGCESCGDWFHGDAFALNLGNINNIRGFKCHRCRTQSMPLCPYLNAAVSEANLLKDKNLGVNHLDDCQKLQCVVYNNEDLPHDHCCSEIGHGQKFMDEGCQTDSYAGGE